MVCRRALLAVHLLACATPSVGFRSPTLLPEPSPEVSRRDEQRAPRFPAGKKRRRDEGASSPSFGEAERVARDADREEVGERKAARAASSKGECGSDGEKAGILGGAQDLVVGSPCVGAGGEDDSLDPSIVHALELELFDHRVESIFDNLDDSLFPNVATTDLGVFGGRGEPLTRAGNFGGRHPATDQPERAVVDVAGSSTARVAQPKRQRRGRGPAGQRAPDDVRISDVEAWEIEPLMGAGPWKPSSPAVVVEHEWLENALAYGLNFFFTSGVAGNITFGGIRHKSNQVWLCDELVWHGRALLGSSKFACKGVGCDCVTDQASAFLQGNDTDQTLLCRFRLRGFPVVEKVMWEMYTRGTPPRLHIELIPDLARRGRHDHVFDKFHDSACGSTWNRGIALARAGPWKPPAPDAKLKLYNDSAGYPFNFHIQQLHNKFGAFTGWAFGSRNSSDNFVWLCAELYWRGGYLTGQARPRCRGDGCDVNAYIELLYMTSKHGPDTMTCAFRIDPGHADTLHFQLGLLDGGPLMDSLSLVSSASAATEAIAK